MKRKMKMEELKNHPWYKKLFAKLKKEDLDFMEEFIKDSEELDKLEYYNKVKRFSLTSNKPKRWSVIEELLSTIN